MPHIDVKFFPCEMTEEQRQAFANDLCTVVKKHLGSKDASLSVALTPVEPAHWKQEVYDTAILPALETLAKKPGYTL